MTWKPFAGHQGPRPSHTYRGARKNAERGTRISLLLKAEKLDQAKRGKPDLNAPKSKHRLGVHAR